MAITKGTLKQIAWAENICADLVAAWNTLEEKHGPAPDVVKKYVTEKILENSEARYYIEAWGQWYKITGKPTSRDIEKLLTNLDGEVGDAAFEWLFLKGGI